MTVPFPPVPRGAVVSPKLVRYGGDLVSSLGGPTQRITRVGSRYAMDVELPPLDADCAGRWLAAALHAEAWGDTLLLTVPQMRDVAGLDACNGTGAAGDAQIVYAGPPPVVGVWFSFEAQGRHFLHLITSVFGPTAVAISPRLRAPMAATPMDFATPKLEGFADETTWSLEYFRFVGHRFTLTENA